jgi:hypothetical protein
MSDKRVKVCPNEECRYHDEQYATVKRWYRPHGYYSLPKEPDVKIRRYRCSTCGRTFSETYFTRSYHLQRKDIDDVELLFEWCKGASIHRLSKLYKCSCKVIENRIVRMVDLAEKKEINLQQSLL